MNGAPVDFLDLQVRRKRLGLRQKDVADWLGVPISYISMLERRGRTLVKREAVERFLDAYEAGLRRQERGR